MANIGSFSENGFLYLEKERIEHLKWSEEEEEGKEF